MLPTLASILVLLSFAAPGGPTTPPHLGPPTFVGPTTILAAPEGDPGRPFDVFFESDPDEEEEDAPTDDALADRGWTFRVTVASACSGDILSVRGNVPTSGRSPILRC